MTSWRAEIGAALEEHGEAWADVEAHTLTPAQLDEWFDSGYGGVNGASFTLWTAQSVYFPACYDGSEWVARVSRHPNGAPTMHVGGS
jgi:hypothetical protein